MEPKRILPWLLMGFSFSVFAGGASSGGGRFAEQNIHFASKQVDLAAAMCLNSLRCNLNDREKSTLLQIREALKSYPLENRIKIVGRAEVGDDFFKVSGRIVNAKTEYRKDADIFVNRDFLYETEPTIKSSAPTVDVAQAIGLLVHELSHQQGIRDEDAADLLGTKVRGVIAGQITEIPIFLPPLLKYAVPAEIPAEDRITAVVINPDPTSKAESDECTAASPCVPKIFVHDRNGISEIGAGPFYGIRDIALNTRCFGVGNSPVLQMRYTNLHMRRQKPKFDLRSSGTITSTPTPVPLTFSSGPVTQDFANLYGDLEFSCEKDVLGIKERVGLDQLSFAIGVEYDMPMAFPPIISDLRFNSLTMFEHKICGKKKKNRCL